MPVKMRQLGCIGWRVSAVRPSDSVDSSILTNAESTMGQFDSARMNALLWTTVRYRYMDGDQPERPCGSLGAIWRVCVVWVGNTRAAVLASELFSGRWRLRLRHHEQGSPARSSLTQTQFVVSLRSKASFPLHRRDTSPSLRSCLAAFGVVTRRLRISGGGRRPRNASEHQECWASGDGRFRRNVRRDFQSGAAPSMATPLTMRASMPCRPRRRLRSRWKVNHVVQRLIPSANGRFATNVAVPIRHRSRSLRRETSVCCGVDDCRCREVIAAANWNLNRGSDGVVTFSPSATVVTPSGSGFGGKQAEQLFGLAYLQTTLMVQIEYLDRRSPDFRRAEKRVLVPLVVVRPIVRSRIEQPHHA